MSDDMNKFLDEGFQRFAEAYEAVTLFTETVEKQLRDMLEPLVWSEFKVDRAKVKTNSGGKPGMGCWIYAFIPGELEGAAHTLDCGFWWSPPKLQARLIAYGNFHNDPAPLQQPDYKPQNSRIRIGKVGSATRLYIVEPDTNPDVDLSAIIHELLAIPRQPERAGK
jgi:hypothetical protein